MSRVVRTAASAAVAVVLTAACAGRSPGASPQPGMSPSPLPDAVRIVCDSNGTTVLTPVVRPQPDGVHLQIQNSTGKDLGFVVGELGGDNAPAGSSELVWPLPPGTTKIGCRDDSQPGGTPPDGQVTVQDPEGIWIDPQPGCTSVTAGAIDYAGGVKGQQGNPVDVARAHLRDRLQEGDVVKAAGYPEAPDRHVIVVRDGSTVADLTYLLDEAGTGWLEDSESTCPGFNG